MDILKNTYNLSKFLLSAEFRAEIYKSDLSYVLCKNGKAQYIIHNLEAFKRIYDLADFGRRRMEIENLLLKKEPYSKENSKEKNRAEELLI